MVKDFIHVGVSVKDMEKSIEFYRDLMEMEEEFRSHHQGERISRVVNVPDAEISVCMLKKGDFRVELIEYIGKKEDPCIHQKQNEVGLIHIAFSVDDVDAAYERIKAEGYEFFAPPMVTRDNGPKITYFMGPDNVVVEIYQKV